LLKDDKGGILFLVTVKNKKGKVFSMARQDNVKIITTALLVVLLLSSFIFGFVYRNEIYQKFQSVSKSNSVDPEERIITKEPAWTPPVTTEKKEEAEPDKTKHTELADIPSLDEMEDTFQKPSTSISVTQPHTLKKKQVSPEPKSEMESKADPSDKLTKSEVTVPATKIEKQKTVIPKKRVETKKYTTYRKATVAKKKYVSQTNKRTTYQKPINTTSRNVSLEARIKSMESSFILQNQKNDMRFTEIEKRIDKLEKSLGSN
jgi:hypothetical protein